MGHTPRPSSDDPRPRPQVAKQVVEELTRQHVPSECLPLDEYDVTKLPHERCVVPKQNSHAWARLLLQITAQPAGEWFQAKHRCLSSNPL